MSFSIYYSTPFDVPAPFSYEVSFDFSADEKLDFEMIYTDREDFSDDELENDDFSNNDNYNWSGNLNSVWKMQIEELLEKTEARKSTIDQEIIIKTDSKEFAPKNYIEWNLLIQDLIQAVFETSGKEQAWQLDLQIIKNGEKKKQKMNVFFSKREVDFAFGSSISIDWAKAKKFMELIYLGEFLEENASAKLPEKDGVYLCFDQQTWYKMGESIKNPNGNKSYLGKLEAELLSLV